MVMFNSPYYNNLDRGYYQPGEARDEPLGVEVEQMPTIYPESEQHEKAEEPILSIKDIGQGVPLGIAANNVAGVDAKLRTGAAHLELQFPGAVRSNRQSQTPGVYGEDQRMALRELKKARDVDFTTHASFGIMGLAGQDQQGNYSKEQRKTAVDEVKRAIEFASDVAEGGSVVVHTGEFQRPISEAVTPDETWRFKTDNKGNILYDQEENPIPMFKGYQEETERAIIRVVDDRTGQVMQQVRKNQNVAIADWRQINEENWREWNKTLKGKRVLEYAIPTDQEFINKWKERKDEFGNPYFTIEKNTGRVIPGKREVKIGDYLDYENRIIVDPLDVEHGRLPEYNTETGRFNVRMRDWNYFVKDAEEWNKLEERRLGRKLSPYEMITPEERYLRSTLETNEGYSRGWALSFSVRMKDSIKRINEYRNALDFYYKLEEGMTEDQKWKLMMESEYGRRIADRLIPRKFETPTEVLKRAIWEEQQELAYNQQSGLSQEKQARDSRETQEHIKSAYKYALEEAKKSYAQLGIEAWKETQTKKLPKPVFITMENIFPESYGGHPQELKKLVSISRDQMVDMLTQEKIEDPMRKTNGKPVLVDNPYYHKGITKQQAENIAKDHIRATLDTGHLNIWRKYFQGTDEDFNKWYLEQVEDLAKDKIIGNVHLADNYGYQDDHLSPGQGNAPVKEALNILKKYGYDERVIVEPGAAATTDNSDFHGLMQTWRYFGNLASPTGSYMGPSRDQADQWGQVQYGYFGRTYSPNFVFGTYTPSQDWTLWTQVPME